MAKSQDTITLGSQAENFGYIIIDEAHHASSPSYQKFIRYFKPKFLLGMTATPERCDGGNIFANNVDDNSIIHAFQCLNQNYYDSAQIKNNIKCFELNGEVLYCTWNFKKAAQNKEHRMYIKDVINYALRRYENEFESKYYGCQ